MFLGYTLTGLNESTHGLTAHLQLAGEECNAFGVDIKSLTVEVTYETDSRYGDISVHDCPNILQDYTSIFTTPKKHNSKYLNQSSLVQLLHLNHTKPPPI